MAPDPRQGPNRDEGFAVSPCYARSCRGQGCITAPSGGLAARTAHEKIRVDKWHEVIGDPTYADAILDRLVHNAHRVDLTGDSLRRTRPRSTTKD
jgi:hypothetical protein